MLKKEMVAKTADEGHVLMTVEQVFRPVGDMDVYYAGWDKGDFGNVNRIPYWKTAGSDRVLKALFCSWQFDSVPNKTIVKRFEEREYTGPIEIEINGAKVSCNFDVTQTVRIDGDPFSLKGSVGKVIPIRFTPPLQDISKKVKLVFTRSRKEGVVNAREGNAYRVGYTRKGKYHQRHEIHCTGDPRWKSSLDFNSRRGKGGQCTYRGCGISICPRLGGRLTRACHLGHIEKYITYWLYRFPSRAPNGGLIRRDHRNVGVTPQLEAPYAA